MKLGAEVARGFGRGGVGGRWLGGTTLVGSVVVVREEVLLDVVVGYIHNLGIIRVSASRSMRCRECLEGLFLA